ncbi:DNA replication/repair protein RecF [Marinobacter confluentis]|uniref:DNA replication and repair protein RecF n=1 Tax=Marinobacter confluentis TaxID=1697557 RepID=A0A4Z1BY72_9GAMM|nr:DNA replication/repair protein RecF [Marinobacter confluentis]TGN39470.1 DNA replication/repair protein RecF [Marinobacter confluentis]
MALVKLQTEHFRNLQGAPVSFSPSINLLFGENGSGKTSILEAIGYLGLGRSFRVSRHQAVVSHGEQKLTVFGGLDRGHEQSRPWSGADPESSDKVRHRLGISRNITEKETRLKVDGEPVRNMSALARFLPVSVIDPGVFDIVAGGPGKRRQFLDWSVFHVEPSFASLWQQCQRVTSQRNQILRNGRLDESLMKVWDAQYVELSAGITRARTQAFQLFSDAFFRLVGEITAPWVEGLKLDFYPGWDQSQSLLEVLKGHREQELKMGHTLYGPNRADIRLKFQGRPVAETFSRGQQKTLVILMKIAQGMVLADLQKQVTFLLDDINAELDTGHRAMLAQKLDELKCQVFVTSIEPPKPEELWQQPLPDYRVFHVEHGKMTEE